jgi:hypothetical protein
VPTLTGIRYGVFECKACQQSDGEGCGDSCFMSWPDELADYVDDELWPKCGCCDAKAHLMEVLIAV